MSAILNTLQRLTVAPYPSESRIQQLSRRARDSRLGSFYTTIPLLRTLGGTNVVQIGFGGSGEGAATQPLNLTVSTCADYVLVASLDCPGCTDTPTVYHPEQSRTLTYEDLAIQYTFPSTITTSNPNLLNLTGQFITETINDARGDRIRRKAILVAGFLDPQGEVLTGDYGTGAGFSSGTMGIWGLGVDLLNPNNSIIAQTLATSDPPQEGLTVGLDLESYSLDVTQPAGSIHWGAVPPGSWRGDWNWIRPSASFASVWAVKLNKLTMNNGDISTSNFRAIIDPAQYVIAVPEQTAISIYERVDGATRDRIDTSRWNIPCDASISFAIHLEGGKYNANSTDLIQHRNARTCWGGIVAWPRGSAMDVGKQVVLGTPFLSNVYTALYYSPRERYIGLAAKAGLAGSVVKPVGDRLSGGAIAGIIIGVIIALLIALSMYFSRSRDSMAGYQSRLIRKQHKLASTQMMHQYPGMPAPPLIMGAPPVMSVPRHMDALYAKPYVPGGKEYEREMAMNMDPMMGMYGQQPGSYPQQETRRGSGFWGGWRRAREESKWRKQNEHSRTGSHPEYHHESGHHYPDPYDQGAHPHGHSTGNRMYAPVAGDPQAEYYGPAHGDPLAYYSHPHHTAPQDHRYMRDSHDSDRHHHQSSHHDHSDHHHHSDHHRHERHGSGGGHHHHHHHLSHDDQPPPGYGSEAHQGGLLDRLRNFGRQ